MDFFPRRLLNSCISVHAYVGTILCSIRILFDYQLPKSVFNFSLTFHVFIFLTALLCSLVIPHKTCVCFINPSGKEPIEGVWKRPGAFRIDL